MLTCLVCSPLDGRPVPVSFLCEIIVDLDSRATTTGHINVLHLFPSFEPNITIALSTLILYFSRNPMSATFTADRFYIFHSVLSSQFCSRLLLFYPCSFLSALCTTLFNLEKGLATPTVACMTDCSACGIQHASHELSLPTPTSRRPSLSVFV